MLDLYKVLGVAQDADEVQIKLAYRKLAKALHPDLNGGNKEAEQRLRAVNCAYETLSNPDARTAYDEQVAEQRARARQRFKSAAMTMAASFTLTITASFLSIAWWHGAGPVAWQEASKTLSLFSTVNAATARVPGGAPAEGAENGKMQVQRGALAASLIKQSAVSLPASEITTDGSKTRTASARPRRASKWVTYRSPQLGVAFRYPADVFAPEPEQIGGDERAFRSRDGRARLLVSASPNVDGLTIEAYRRTLIEQRSREANLDRTPHRGSWFVLSGSRQEEIFYERVTFACDGRTLHSWQLTYPLLEREFYDRIAEEIHRSYRHEREGRCEGTRSAMR
jgi:curved DNA-binding protein CbpA